MSYKKFEDLLKEKNTTTYRVSKATGISGATFSDWKSGRSSPKLDKIKMIADYFGVPIDYFLESDAQSDSVFGYAPKKLSRVPVVGDIRAGKPIITSETLLGYENADIPDPDDYFYLRIKGDSMKNAGIVDGSLVLFKKQQYAEDGEIVACLVDGDSSTVKRYTHRGKKIYLLPENPDYDPIEIDPIDFETGDARILGIAVEVKIKL